MCTFCSWFSACAHRFAGTVAILQRCGKADPSTTSAAFRGRRYTEPIVNYCWSLCIGQRGTCKNLHRAIRNSEATEGKTCAMREARSSSSPEAAAISFTYSRQGYVHLIALYPAMIMAIITRQSGTPCQITSDECISKSLLRRPSLQMICNCACRKISTIFPLALKMMLDVRSPSTHT